MKAAALLAVAVATPAVVSGMTRVEVPRERVQSDRQLEVSCLVTHSLSPPAPPGRPRPMPLQ